MFTSIPLEVIPRFPVTRCGRVSSDFQLPCGHTTSALTLPGESPYPACVRTREPGAKEAGNKLKGNTHRAEAPTITNLRINKFKSKLHSPGIYETDLQSIKDCMDTVGGRQ